MTRSLVVRAACAVTVYRRRRTRAWSVMIAMALGYTAIFLLGVLSR